MQATLYNEIEFAILESLINGMNKREGQNTVLLDVMKGLRSYLGADEALLILFDLEDPDIANVKLLGDGEGWETDGVLSVNKSHLCSHPASTATLISPLAFNDPQVFSTFSKNVDTALLAPLTAEGSILGLVLFSDPQTDFKDERMGQFLQLMFNGFANAIFAVEHNRQLVISKAALEANKWQILNSRNILRTFFDNIPLHAYVIDRSYDIVIINRIRSERQA